MKSEPAPVEIIATEMFDALNTYNVKVQRAITERRFKDTEQARKELDFWFFQRGIILIEAD